MNSSIPLVTVLMPVYNGEKYLAESIESVLNQTYTNYEFLILNDGSTDNSINIINTFYDDRINLVTNSHNLGLTATLNKGINIAKGRYIARLDQDDISNKTRVELQVEYLINNPDIVLVGTNCEYIDSKNTINGKWTTATTHFDIINSFYKQNPFAHSSVMFNKKKVINVGGYPKNYIYAQDLALWIRICSKYRVANLNENVTQIRIHDQQVTFDNNLQQIKIAEELSLMKESLNIPDLLYLTIFRIYVKIIRLIMVTIKKKYFNKIFFRLQLFHR